jgi:hypothetical protein
VLAWSHDGYRRHMLRHPNKYVGVPLLILIFGTLFGYLAGQYLSPIRIDPATLNATYDASDFNPLYLLLQVMMLWNFYHFGMQAFGVMSVYRVKAGWYSAGQRRFDQVFCCAVCWLAMSLPLIHKLSNWLHGRGLPSFQRQETLWAFIAIALASVGIMLWREIAAGRLCVPRLVLIANSAVGLVAVVWWPILGFGIILMTHWLQAIGLAGHASRHNIWTFCPALIIAGVVLYLGLFADWHNMLVIPATVAATAVGFRELGMGTVHFLMDRWVWKLSDPRVRETIGKSLLGACEPIPQ